MSPTPNSRLIDARRAAALQARLEEATDLGLLRRVDEPNQYVLWRYDGVDIAYSIKCYKGKRGLSVVQSDERIGAKLADGKWVELFQASDAQAQTRTPAADRSTQNAFGTLTRLPRPDVETSPAARGGRPRPIAVADLSPDQARVFAQVRRWLEEPDRPVLTLGGYAGTGKSTLVGLLARELAGQRRVGFCAYTGKAANVLRGKLTEAGADATSCSTIHALVYEPVMEPRTGRVIEWNRRPRLDLDLLVVDEASMVGPEMLDDLLGYRVPILAVGDHGQLPPVGRDRGLMSAPDLRLEVVHRQARGHPIIDLSMRIRAGADPMAVTIDDPRVRRLSGRAELESLLPQLIDTPQAADQTVVLCHYNATRVRLNQAIRRHLALDGDVAPADRVICLRNTRFCSVLIANGMRGAVESVEPDGEHWLRARVRHEDEGVSLDGRLSRHQFGREYTFAEYADVPFEARSWTDVGLLYDHGYALTVHKAQGSQWRRVIVCIERGRGDDAEFRRWLYTAVTRAVEAVVLVEL